MSIKGLKNKIQSLNRNFLLTIVGQTKMYGISIVKKKENRIDRAIDTVVLLLFCTNF